MFFRGLKEDVSLFEVEGFSLMTLVTIMEFILLSLCEVDIGGVNNINT